MLRDNVGRDGLERRQEQRSKGLQTLLGKGFKAVYSLEVQGFGVFFQVKTSRQIETKNIIKPRVWLVQKMCIVTLEITSGPHVWL